MPTTTHEKPVCLPGSLDNKGTPFDPARHVARMHPKSGRWMPRSPGRGHKGQTRLPGVDTAAPAPAAPTASTAAPASPAAAPTVPEAVTVTADDLVDLPDVKPGPDAPAAPGPAADAAAQAAPAPGPEPLPEIGPGETLPPPGTSPACEPVRVRVEPPPAGGKPSNDVRLDHQAAGELAARTTYALTGALIGNHKKATASGPEHESLKSAFASFFQFRGVVFVGSVALGLVLLAYFLGEARKEEVFSTFKRLLGKKPETQASPGPAPAPAAKPATPPPAPAGATPDRPFILGEN